jgi:hypothetical protein
MGKRFLKISAARPEGRADRGLLPVDNEVSRPPRNRPSLLAAILPHGFF